MDLGHHILAVMHDRSALRRAQGDVKHRAVLRDVDLVAPEHGVDAVPQPRFLRKLKQQFQGFVGDPFLGIVRLDPTGLDGQPFPAIVILGKELTEVQALRRLVVRLQQRPGRAHAQGWHAHRLAPRELCCTLARTGCHRHLRQLALRMAALLDSTQAIRSFQDLTNDEAPSFWSRTASASMSTPALAKLARTVSHLPPSGASMSPTSPGSPKAWRVLSGLVFTVNGAASAFMSRR